MAQYDTIFYSFRPELPNWRADLENSDIHAMLRSGHVLVAGGSGEWGSFGDLIKELVERKAIGPDTVICVQVPGFVEGGVHRLRIAGDIRSALWLGQLENLVKAFKPDGTPVNWTGSVVLRTDVGEQLLADLGKPGAPALTRTVLVGANLPGGPDSRLLSNLNLLKDRKNPYEFIREDALSNDWMVREPGGPIFKIPLPLNAALYDGGNVREALSAYQAELSAALSYFNRPLQERNVLRQALARVGSLLPAPAEKIEAGSLQWWEDIGHIFARWESSSEAFDDVFSSEAATYRRSLGAFYQSVSNWLASTNPTLTVEMLEAVMRSGSMKAAELVFKYKTTDPLTPSQAQALLKSLVDAKASKQGSGDYYLETARKYFIYLLAQGADFTSKPSDGGMSLLASVLPPEDTSNTKWLAEAHPELMPLDNSALIRLMAEFDPVRVLPALFDGYRASSSDGNSVFFLDRSELNMMGRGFKFPLLLPSALLELVPDYVQAHPESRERLFDEVAEFFSHLHYIFDKETEETVFQDAIASLNFWSLEDRQELLNQHLVGMGGGARVSKVCWVKCWKGIWPYQTTLFLS